MQLIIAKTRRLTDFFEQSCSTQSAHSAPGPAIKEDVTSLSAEIVKLPSASNIDSNVAETSVDEAPTRSIVVTGVRRDPKSVKIKSILKTIQIQSDTTILLKISRKDIIESSRITCFRLLVKMVNAI